MHEGDTKKEAVIMKKSGIKEILKNGIRDKFQINIYRKKIDAKPISAIPIIMGEKLLLTVYLYDFQIDGFEIIRIKDITSVRVSNSETFSDHILKTEGIYEQIKKTPLTNLDDWKCVFSDLKTLGNNIIIECEGNVPQEFYIGKIIKVDISSVLLLYFNGIGEWDDEPTKISFKEITSVSFDKRYINIMSKYVKSIP